MFLLEHHGKELLASHGIAVPAGVFVPSGGDPLASRPPSGPLMVKAQVAAGGRGKAGAVQRAESLDQAARIIAALEGSDVNGKPIHGFRIEQHVDFAHEAYLSLSVDPEAARIRMILAANGGVDVEARAMLADGVRSVLAGPEHLADAAMVVCAAMPPSLRAALSDAAPRLAAIFLRYEATLLEVNPLFIRRDGTWIVGDIKLVIDDNAIVRQPAISALLEQHPDIYPESACKLAHGFDYVEVDAHGEIGLITTGAGLSMQLIDELVSQGRRPLNFCDIRSGQFRGDPARLIAVMRRIASRPTVGVVLVNIFAGITDLAEFARLLVEAARQVPELRIPIVARLIGRNLDDAIQILSASALSVTVEPDLGRAIDLTLAALAGEGGAVDSSLFDPEVPVIIQGITGRAGRTHADLMQRYGTRVVGGVAGSASGSKQTRLEPVAGIPVFASCAEAVACTGARASIVMVPPLNVLAAAQDALASGIELLVCVAEGVPVHDTLKLVRLSRERSAVCIGPSTPGIAVPGRMKIGFLPDAALIPGPLAVMSKSGTLSYELCYRLGQRGIGQSLWIGVGGDAVKGTRFADLVPLFQAHRETEALLVIGEIGGSEEEELAETLLRERFGKPVFALLAGSTAPEGVTMGHAGALVHGTRGTAASKVAALGAAGVRVHATMRDIVEDVARVLASAPRIAQSRP